MSPEDGAFGKHLMTPEVLMTVIWSSTLIILAFILCMFYLMLELIRKPDTEKSNIHVYIGRTINSRVSNGQSFEIGDIRADGGVNVQSNVQCEKPKNHSNFKKSINTEQRQPKRKPKMSKPSSEIKEKEELLQESSAIQLLSQIYDMTQSLLRDTREVIKKFEQDEGTSKNSTEYIKTELQARQKEKESQSLFPDNVSPGEAPGSLEIAPFLKNNSLRRITYDFNEPQPPAASPEKPLKEASNTNSDSNISTSTDLYTLLITLALNFFLILRGYGVNLFLYFPFINDYSRNSNRHKQSIGDIGADGGQVQVQSNVQCEKQKNHSNVKSKKDEKKDDAPKSKKDEADRDDKKEKSKKEGSKKEGEKPKVEGSDATQDISSDKLIQNPTADVVTARSPAPAEIPSSGPIFAPADDQKPSEDVKTARNEASLKEKSEDTSIPSQSPAPVVDLTNNPIPPADGAAPQSGVAPDPAPAAAVVAGGHVAPFTIGDMRTDCGVNVQSNVQSNVQCEKPKNHSNFKTSIKTPAATEKSKKK